LFHTNIWDNFQHKRIIIDNFQLYFMGTLLRIKEIAKDLGHSLGAFEKMIGASKGVLSRAIKRNSDIQSKWISNIIEIYPQYNANWLVTGNGNKLIEKKGVRFKESPSPYNKKSSPSKKRTASRILKIPLIEINTTKKLNDPGFLISEENIIDYFKIPKFRNKKVDFMIEIADDSMTPRYKTGDLVACSIIKNSKFIQWNKPHLVVTNEQGILIKRLKQSKSVDCMQVISDNANYEPFDIPLKEITSIALIVGGIFSE